MNVYIRAVAERLAEHDVEVDLFTRCRGADGPEILEIGPGVRLVTVKAGPCAPVPKIDLPRFLPEFLGGVLRRAKADGRGYDILHSHYWLSGWVGSSAKDILGIPLVASFHTLGKVKNYSLARGEAPEPPSRLMGEERVIAGADRILAPTPAEAAQLVGLYRADPEHIRIVPPGVDHAIFFPRERAAARDRLHLSGLRLALFVGRLQAHKGPDVAVRTLAEAVARDPELTQDLVLAIVGGPSGTGQGAELARLMELAAALGVSERVMLFPPLPQARLADVYAAADVVLVPSRSESFGLVALEAQACGTPVVAAAVGRTAVRRRRRTDRVPGRGPRPGRPRRADAPDPAGPGARRPSRGRGGEGGAPLHVGRHRERARRHLPRADGGPHMIQGERVTLRPVEERDYPLIHAWQNDPEVWWLMDYEAPFSLADIAASEKRATEEGFPFIIEAEGRPIGRIGINNIRRRDRICALYVFIGDRTAWGKGLGTDAVDTMLAHAFSRFDLHQVELWSLAENERALRAYAHSGFREEARLAERSWKDGRWVDRVLMSVTRENFEAARTARDQRER